MIAKLSPTFLAVMLLARADTAAESSAAVALIAPEQVELGMSSATLKAVRPKAFNGPEASRPNGPQRQKWPTMMEVIDLGQPSQVSFWYLFSNDKLTGLLRTRNLALVPPDRQADEASSAYKALTGLLGAPRQESVLRKGNSSFVPVRADMWSNEGARLSFYFIATTKEITTAVVAPSDFPMEQVMIRPDPNRFEVEDEAAQTVADLPRSQPQGEDGGRGVNKAPTLASPSLPQSKPAKPTVSMNTAKSEQSKDNTRSFGLWALIIVITLGALWMVWGAISKPRRSSTK